MNPQHCTMSKLIQYNHDLSILSNNMKILLFSLLQTLSLAGTNKRSVIHSLPSEDYTIYSLISIFLVLIGGTMSGLTVGLLGIDELALELKIASGTSEEKKNALKVLKVINNHHLLLVTLLLANALAMEALPLFLDTIFNTELSLFISVTFVLAFGEVIPQSLCTGSNQIKIACKCVPIVKVVMFLLFPLAYPIAKLLDKIFGYKEIKRKLGNNDLKAFIRIQKGELIRGKGLDNFQIQIMHKIMDLHELNIKDIVISLDDVTIISADSKVNKELISRLYSSPYEIVVVYNYKKENVCGHFRMQKLFAALSQNDLRIRNINLEDVNTVNYNDSLLNCLKLLESWNCDIGYVSNEIGVITGIIRKTDILNQILSSTEMNDKAGIIKISNALSKVLERQERNSGTKTELIIRKERVVSC